MKFPALSARNGGNTVLSANASVASRYEASNTPPPMASSMNPSCARTDPAPGNLRYGGQPNSNQSADAISIRNRKTGSSTHRFSKVPDRMLAPRVQPDSPLPAIR
jgi:hypothetical protein